MSTRPLLTINPQTHAVEGWDAFVMWSTMNDPQFNAVVQVSDRCGLREIERLKALLASYTHAADEARRQLVAAGVPCPPIPTVVYDHEDPLAKFMDPKLGKPWIEPA